MFHRDSSSTVKGLVSSRVPRLPLSAGHQHTRQNRRAVSAAVRTAGWKERPTEPRVPRLSPTLYKHDEPCKNSPKVPPSRPELLSYYQNSRDALSCRATPCCSRVCQFSKAPIAVFVCRWLVLLDWLLVSALLWQLIFSHFGWTAIGWPTLVLVSLANIRHFQLLLRAPG